MKRFHIAIAVRDLDASIIDEELRLSHNGWCGEEQIAHH